jgi:hypothetical protein
MIMKQILGVHGKTPNLAIHAELGLIAVNISHIGCLFGDYAVSGTFRTKLCKNDV